VKDTDIDELLGQSPNQVDPALLDRVTASIGASLRPVRPMAPAWMLASILWLLSAGIAVLSAYALGTYGIQKLNGAETAAIFSALGVFTWLAALLSVAAMIPGGMRWNPARLLLIVLVAWIALDAVLFHDYQMDAFVRQGIPCLRAGLIVAVPTGVASWLVLRRGFAVSAAAAGLAAGTLAGLAGLIMLEIHCPNLHAMHVMVWHTAVIPISALVGTLLTRLLNQ
jgi:hypothetical protein